MVRSEVELDLLPRDAGLLDHCRRVGALALAIAHHLFLETEEKNRLHNACLLHHYDLELLAGPPSERLLEDVLGTKPAGKGFRVPDELRPVLEALRVPGAGTSSDRRLAEILRMCDAFDQEYEAAPLEAREVAAILPALGAGVQGGLWGEQYVNALSEATLPVPLPAPGSWRVPSFPQAAARVLDLLGNPRASTRQIEEAAGTDPAIAGRVMQMANSALFGARAPISTLRDAVTRLGFDTAQKVVTGAALRAVLVHPKMVSLWPHSLAAGDLASQLAARSGLVDSSEAFLCGLLHDIGRYAVSAVPLYDSARLLGFAEGGCPPVYAENLLLRTDHGALGAAIAQTWRLPAHLVGAIGYHHRPEKVDNRLAAVLYLVEDLLGGAEDLPSRFRFDWCLRTLAVTDADLYACEPSKMCELLAA